MTSQDDHEIIIMSCVLQILAIITLQVSPTSWYFDASLMIQCCTLVMTGCSNSICRELGCDPKGARRVNPTK